MQRIVCGAVWLAVFPARVSNRVVALHFALSVSLFLGKGLQRGKEGKGKTNRFKPSK